MTTDHPNTTLASAVDQTVTMADELGLQSAARFLAAHGTGLSLVCRVLAEPARRREVESACPPPQLSQDVVELATPPEANSA